MRDPFIVHTPEQLSPRDIADNFVEMYTDFPKLKEVVNMFIHGPRGAGKSIMLRSLEHQVQALLTPDDKERLPFFAVHVPIKDIFFGNPEYRRLRGWKATAVGEHLLTVYSLQYLCRTLQNLSSAIEEKSLSEFRSLWEDCGGSRDTNVLSALTDFESVSRFLSKEASRVRQYYVRLPDAGDPDIYSGALSSYSDLLLPFCRNVQASRNDILGRPVCFMIDDADNLPEALQRVLNSWISTRTGQTVCFKVTTQLAYKTYRTIDNRIIESPHDFTEVNIGSVYTASKGSFAKRIAAIVSKRLQNAGIKNTPEGFFPTDSAQLIRKSAIWEDLLNGNFTNYISLKGSGPSRQRDMAQRYAIPALMRELSHSKSAHTYSYSGLQSLIDLSSGVVRWFLEPAGQMYHQVRSTGVDLPDYIPVNVQDAEILRWSKAFRERLDVDPGEVDGDAYDVSLQSVGHSRKNYQNLANLLDGIGLLCREKLLDPSASEQRVFSFVLSDEPDEELSLILHLGVRLGYLQKADLASKSALGGRRPRYILSRRLGPHYRLDVSGYAAHLSLTAGDLRLALTNPKEFVRKRLTDAEPVSNQQTIDFGDC